MNSQEFLSRCRISSNILHIHIGNANYCAYKQKKNERYSVTRKFKKHNTTNQCLKSRDDSDKNQPKENPVDKFSIL